jgi:hypothetical protein
MCSTLSHRKASRPVRSQSSGTADAGRVPTDGSGHAALLPLVWFLARQAAMEAMQAEPSPVSNSLERP